MAFVEFLNHMLKAIMPNPYDYFSLTTKYHITIQDHKYDKQCTILIMNIKIRPTEVYLKDFFCSGTQFYVGYCLVFFLLYLLVIS